MIFSAKADVPAIALGYAMALLGRLIRERIAVPTATMACGSMACVLRGRLMVASMRFDAAARLSDIALPRSPLPHQAGARNLLRHRTGGAAAFRIGAPAAPSPSVARSSVSAITTAMGWFAITHLAFPAGDRPEQKVRLRVHGLSAPAGWQASLTSMTRVALGKPARRELTRRARCC